MFENMNLRFGLKGLIGVGIVILFLLPYEISFDYDIEGWQQDSDPHFWDWIGQTTAGLASGAATPDGRPFTWKSRDRTERFQMEFRYVDDGRIPFISVTDFNSETDMYGGMNAAGFAVENTDAHNFAHLGNSPDRNGWGSTPDDGQIHRLALATCRTVDEFAALLDSLNFRGRTYNYTWRAIDAFGGAAVFETAAYEYFRFDAIDEPEGILVRSNHGLAGSDPGLDDFRYGLHRYARTNTLFREAALAGTLTPQYVINVVCRDLTNRDINPYPLPYKGYDGDLPYGLVDNGASIGRSTTRAVLVAHGVRPYENPADAVLWSMVGSPMSGVATPLWVRAGSVPIEYLGTPTSRLSDRMNELRNWTYSVDIRGVDTYKLTNEDGTGLWDYVFPLQNWVFDKTAQFINSEDYSHLRLESFQNEMAQQVADSLDNWRPRMLKVSDIAEPFYWENGLHLQWGEISNELFAIDEQPLQYVVYRSNNPFRENETGEQVAIVNGNSWIDTDPPSGRVFYRVEAHY